MLYRLLNKISRKIHPKPRRNKKKKYKNLAGLTLFSTLEELSGFVLNQWPEKDKNI